MFKAPGVRLRRYRLLVLGLALSLLVHFVLVPLVMGLFGLRRAAPEPQERTYQTSSVLRISAVSRPHPAHLPRTRPQPGRPVRAPQQRPVPQPRKPEQPARREIAKVTPRGRIAVPRLPRASQSIDFARDQRQFERTIARLRTESNPIVSAARPVQTPAAAKHFNYDFGGSIGTAPVPQGILTPVKSWRDGPYRYYYVQYYVQYADGTTETGYVPWPIRFPLNDDPFAQNWEHVPLPVPLPGYVLPPGTNLHPLAAYCYEHREQFATCPIAHG